MSHICADKNWFSEKGHKYGQNWTAIWNANEHSQTLFNWYPLGTGVELKWKEVVLYVGCVLCNILCITRMVWYPTFYKRKKLFPVLALWLFDRYIRRKADSTKLSRQGSFIILWNMGKGWTINLVGLKKKFIWCLVNMQDKCWMLSRKSQTDKRQLKKCLNFFGLMQYNSLSPLETVGSIQAWVTSENEVSDLSLISSGHLFTLQSHNIIWQEWQPSYWGRLG